MGARPPIVAAELYGAVVERGHHRCQCDGQKSAAGCGGPHRVSIGSCDTFAQRGVPLLVVPADPMVADHVAAGLGPEQLVALCRGCSARRTTRTRRWRREEIERQAAEDQGALFDL